MDVYLVPVGPDKHELYCEVPDEPEEADEDVAEREGGTRGGFFRRMRDRFRGMLARMRERFRAMLAEAERERRQARTAAAAQGGWLVRMKSRIMRWVAESIAEQRLLWHLRRQTAACLYYPDDLEESAAIAALRAQLGRDFDKHRFWLTIDGLGFVASGLVFLVPGPNIIAYYFAFRLVGHYFSLRGARQGLSGVTWTTQKSEALSELRRAINLAPDLRERRVNEVATRLRLEHLASFFERTAVPLS
jgi:Mitochondrial K+-H+ exchange-related